jgi:hypothetical protein
MTNELEQKSIDGAFTEAIVLAYSAMLNAYIEADGIPSEQSKADERFKRLLSVARLARQQALKQL